MVKKSKEYILGKLENKEKVARSAFEGAVVVYNIGTDIYFKKTCVADSIVRIEHDWPGSVKIEGVYITTSEDIKNLLRSDDIEIIRLGIELLIKNIKGMKREF